MEDRRIRAGSVFVCAAGLLLGVSVAEAQFGGLDASIDPDPGIQNEISLTLVPGTVSGQPQVLMAAYNDVPFPGGNGLGVSYSTNGGATWSGAQLPFPTSSITGVTLADAFDPTVTVDTQGRLFVAHISTDGFIGSPSGVSGLYVRTSTNSGQTWSKQVEVSADPGSSGPPDPAFRFNDRCQMTADRFSASPHTDRIYIAWIKDRGWYDRNDPLNPPPTPSGAPPSDIYFSYSATAGASFSTPAIINDSGHDLGNMPVPRVAADGTVLVSWLDYDVWNGGQGTIYLDRSSDGGMTWGVDQFVTTVNLPPLNVTTGAAMSDALAKGAPVLATSPANANHLYLVYAADPDGPLADEADIFFIRSLDQGATWSTPLRVNTDATVNDQILPWIDVKPNGVIDLAWYDRQNDVFPPDPPPDDERWDVFVTQSLDGGVSFLPETRINDTSFVTPAGGSWMGEYLGLAVDVDHAYVVWTASLDSTANGDIYFDKLINPSLGTTTLPPVTTTVSTTTTTTTSATTSTSTTTSTSASSTTSTTTTSSTTLPPPCGPGPAAGCRLASAGKAFLQIKDSTNDFKDQLKWKWANGDATDLADFKNPVGGTAGCRVCLYDSSGSGQPLAVMDVAAGGMCGTKPCWKAMGDKGFKYKDKAAVAGGVQQVKLKAGAAGKAQVQTKAKGAALPTPALPLTLPVTVQLLIEDGLSTECWQTTYTGTPLKNDSAQFKAKGP